MGVPLGEIKLWNTRVDVVSNLFWTGVRFSPPPPSGGVMLFGPFHSDGVSVEYLGDRFEDFCLRAAGSGHPD